MIKVRFIPLFFSISVSFLNQKWTNVEWNVWNSFQEIIDSTGVAESTLQVVLLPADVIYLAWNVGADNVAFLDLIECNVRIVDTDQNDSRVGSFVMENFVVKFWDGNGFSCAANIEENFAENIWRVLELGYSECSSVNVKIDVSVGSQGSKNKNLIILPSFIIILQTSTRLPRLPSSEHWIFATNKDKNNF